MSPARAILALTAAIGGALALAAAAPAADEDAPVADPGRTAAVVEALPAPGGVDSPVLSLDECLRRANEGNLGLEQVRLRDREISGQGLQALATGLPSVDLVGTWTRSRDPSILLDQSLGGGGSSGVDTLFGGIDFSSFLPSPDELQAQTFWRGNLSSDWEVNPFRVWNAIEGVSVTREAFTADVLAEEQRVADETIRTFHEASFHAETVAALDAEIDARREFLDITRKRFRLELSTELDTLQAAVSLANLLPERRRAVTSLRDAASRLNILMGRGPMEPLRLASVEEVEAGRIDPAVAMAAAERRPDVRSTELAIRFLEKRRGVERAGRKPFFTANGTWGYVARDFQDLVDRDYEAWQASVSLVVPLFDGLEVTGRSRELDAQIVAARKGLDEARRRARLEVATTLQELEAARENLDAARLNLVAADRALERTMLRYDLGQSDYLTLLNAQSERFSARSHLIEARREVLSTTSALKRAMGFHPRTPLEVVREELEELSP